MTDAEKTAEAPAPIKAQKTAPDGYVLCRVLKNGDGKVSRGTHGPNGENYFAKGDEFHAEKAIADALEDRGFVEIQ